jgi:5-methyltetrahydropteroyltriglutamate--homocysteine methyltransferase
LTSFFQTWYSVPPITHAVEKIMTAKTSVLGFPRMGHQRELKKALESYWKGQSSLSDLQNTAKELRQKHWQLMKSKGIDVIPSNDFSFYDQVLDMSCLLGNIPNRIEWNKNQVDWDTYFLVARGQTAKASNRQETTASEMTKWFDTNYHYIVPEFDGKTQFKLASTKPFDEYQEAKAIGIDTRPVIIGPVTYLTVGKETKEAPQGFNRFSLLNSILPIYVDILKKFDQLGAKTVQIDEPILGTDLNQEQKEALKTTYETLAKQIPGIQVILTSYFSDYRDNFALAKSLPVAGIHIDAVRAADEVQKIASQFPQDKTLSLGIIDGRNIWKNNLEKSLETIKSVQNQFKGNLIISTSCSLLHSPFSLSTEKKLDDELKSWLSFSEQKLEELATLAKLANGDSSANADLEINKKAVQSRKTSTRIHNPQVQARMAKIAESDFHRQSPFANRQKKQQDIFQLPLFPTTTIGSFPQTQDVREARAKFKKGELTQAQYDEFIAEKTIEVIKIQEELNIDVLVHGEFERNDMVEYFGEQLQGVAFTENGWVQSYGSRCVKPPFIFGDVSRPEPMTVQWSKFAQDHTKRIMKGMLTGPITILQWSFVRDDQPRKDTTYQIGLAIRDEVADLEKAGITMIQIDEPAIREGLPIRRDQWNTYLDWAVKSFKLATCSVADETQIHTHMCYSEFNDIIKAIADLDADVISIETSRSKMELLDAFVNYNYPNEVGPGVYDIHSPRIPTISEMEELIVKAKDVLPVRNIWINPDCGLKTRQWEDVKAALKNMVIAAENLRKKVEVAV